MITRTEIEDWINDISNIIIDLNISIQNAQRLTENKFEFEKDIKKHGFFQYHWYQLKFIIIVQLCKLLSDKSNEKRSFCKLFNRLENDKYETGLKELLNNNKGGNSKLYTSKNDIKSHIQILRTQISSNTLLIEKVIEARDKIYAHKDPNANVPLVEFEELKFLTKLSSEIFNELQFSFFLKTTWLEELNDWSINYVLWYMSELREIDNEERKRKIAIYNVNSKNRNS